MSDEFVATDRERKLMEIMSTTSAQVTTDTMKRVWTQLKTDLDTVLKKAQDETVGEVQKHVDSFLEQVSQNQSLTMSLSAVLEAVAEYLKKNNIVKADFDDFVKAELKAFEERLIKQVEESQKQKQPE